MAIAAKLRHQCLRHLIAAMIRTQNHFHCDTVVACVAHVARAVKFISMMNFID
jgi:hypothetical protein